MTECIEVSLADHRKLLNANEQLRGQVARLQAAAGRELTKARGLRAMVWDFHRLVGQPIRQAPGIPSDDRVRLRLRLVAEEFFELLEACDIHQSLAQTMVFTAIAALHTDGADPNRISLPDFVDALADLDYVIEGSRLEFGVDGWPIAQEVHRANMEKQGGGLDEHGKAIKPEGWEPPDIVGELRAQGLVGDPFGCEDDGEDGEAK